NRQKIGILRRNQEALIVQEPPFGIQCVGGVKLDLLIDYLRAQVELRFGRAGLEFIPLVRPASPPRPFAVSPGYRLRFQPFAIGLEVSLHRWITVNLYPTRGEDHPLAGPDRRPTGDVPS